MHVSQTDERIGSPRDSIRFELVASSVVAFTLQCCIPRLFTCPRGHRLPPHPLLEAWHLALSATTAGHDLQHYLRQQRDVADPSVSSVMVTVVSAPQAPSLGIYEQIRLRAIGTMSTCHHGSARFRNAASPGIVNVPHADHASRGDAAHCRERALLSPAPVNWVEPVGHIRGGCGSRIDRQPATALTTSTKLPETLHTNSGRNPTFTIGAGLGLVFPDGDSPRRTYRPQRPSRQCVRYRAGTATSAFVGYDRMSPALRFIL